MSISKRFPNVNTDPNVYYIAIDAAQRLRMIAALEQESHDDKALESFYSQLVCVKPNEWPDDLPSGCECVESYDIVLYESERHPLVAALQAYDVLNPIPNDMITDHNEMTQEQIYESNTNFGLRILASMFETLRDGDDDGNPPHAANPDMLYGFCL
jgi:hypothetical protein